MTKATKENIIAIFDESIDKRKAVRELSETFMVTRDEIKEILREYDRAVPYERKKTKAEEPKEAAVHEDPKETSDQEPPKAADQDRHLPMPQYIVEVLTRELDCLDGQIEAVQQQLDELNQRYTQIAEFLIGTKP